jgi:hypothetical protein
VILGKNIPTGEFRKYSAKYKIGDILHDDQNMPNEIEGGCYINMPLSEIREYLDNLIDINSIKPDVLLSEFLERRIHYLKKLKHRKRRSGNESIV